MDGRVSRAPLGPPGPPFGSGLLTFVRFVRCQIRPWPSVFKGSFTYQLTADGGGGLENFVSIVSARGGLTKCLADDKMRRKKARKVN